MSRDRERQAIALVPCPACHAPRGEPCRGTDGASVHQAGRPFVHTERRAAWQAAKPRDAVDGADIVMSDQKEGEPGRWHTFVMLAPLTDRGRAALPEGPTRVEHQAMRATLARLRGQGLVVMRED